MSTTTNRRRIRVAAAVAVALLTPAATAQADTFITSGPAHHAATADPTPQFSFTSTSPSATFQCSVNGGAWTACASPYALPLQAEGAEKAFMVRDVVGGLPDFTPAVRVFTVDLSAPVITIAGPSSTLDSTPTFTFSAPSDGISPYAFSCRIDDGTATPCNGGTFTAPAVTLGAHTFSVRGTDGVGNISAWKTHAFTRTRLKWPLPPKDEPAPETPAAPGPAAPATTAPPSPAPAAPAATAPAVAKAKAKSKTACAKRKPRKAAKRKPAARSGKKRTTAKAAAAKTCAKKAAKKKAVKRGGKRRG